MDSNLNRVCGQFVRNVARTMIGFSALAGCITTAATAENFCVFTNIATGAAFAAVSDATMNVTNGAPLLSGGSFDTGRTK